MKKAKTYLRYLYEYLKYGDFISIFASIRFLLNMPTHSGDRVIRTSIGKFYCRKNTNDFQFANFHYEWGVKKFLLDHKDEYSVFIDGGACIGDYCILLSRYNIRCIAFEPVTDNFNTLLKNLKLNDLTADVLALPVGLGDRNIEASFVFSPVNTGASHISGDQNSGDIRVQIGTLDSFINELKIGPHARIMLKLDIEGMEAEAIRGARNFIWLYPNLTLIIEDKHSGEDSIRKALEEIAVFEFGIVDEYNIFAKKIENKPNI
ncbi:MAG: FkbM family methyltransferase [Bacteroidetes bacterium]|nr:FkbM family methyltransferase [Bacteroidota bacterium]